MKILLDECIDWRFARGLPAHDVSTVAQMTWQGTRNGELLAKAKAAGFEAFVTVDRNLAFQQDLGKVDLAVFVLRARSNRLHHLMPLARKLLIGLSKVRPGEVRFIS